MARFSIAETRNNLSKLVERAEHGETIEVTRHGKPVIRMVPYPEGQTKPDWRETIARILANPVEPVGVPVDSTSLIREMRDEGY